MRTKWSKPSGLDGQLNKLALDLEEQINEPLWRWGGAGFENEPSTAGLPPDPDPDPSSDPPGGEWPGPAAGTSLIPGTGGDGPLDPTIRGNILWHIDVPQNILKLRLFTPVRTEGSSATGFLLVRLRNYVTQKWIGPAFSSMEGEFGPEPLEEEVRDGLVEPGATIGIVAMQIGQGPTSGSRTCRMGVQFVRR